MCVCSGISDSVTPGAIAWKFPLPMGFSRQGRWHGLPFPSPEDLPDPGMEPVSLMSPALAGRFFTSTTWEAREAPHCIQYFMKVGGEGDDRGWVGWMASLTQWTWVWVDSGSWWWTGRPGKLWFTESQRVGQDWETELNLSFWYPRIWDVRWNFVDSVTESLLAC